MSPFVSVTCVPSFRVIVSPGFAFATAWFVLATSCLPELCLLLFFPALELLVVVPALEELGFEVDVKLLPRELPLEEPLEELELLLHDELDELDELDEPELLFLLPPFTSKRSWSSVSSIKLLRSKSLKSLFFIKNYLLITYNMVSLAMLKTADLRQT